MCTEIERLKFNEYFSSPTASHTFSNFTNSRASTFVLKRGSTLPKHAVIYVANSNSAKYTTTK